VFGLIYLKNRGIPCRHGGELSKLQEGRKLERSNGRSLPSLWKKEEIGPRCEGGKNGGETPGIKIKGLNYGWISHRRDKNRLRRTLPPACRKKEQIGESAGE